VILCSGTLGDIPFREKAEAAAAAGFDGVSIYAGEFDPSLRRVLDDLGLTVAEVDGTMAWMPGQPGLEPARVLDVAADLGARSCTVLFAGDEPVEVDRAIEAFGALCDVAAPLGIVLHIEPFAWSRVATLAATAEILAGAGRANSGIMFDTWHHVRGPDRGVLDRSAVDWIVAVQVSDPAPVARPSLPEDCMQNRLWPGPVARTIVAELRAAGCHAPLEVECFTDGSRPLEQARAATDACRDLVGGLP
jgi:sugar phosphate isomerase/epimerase